MKKEYKKKTLIFLAAIFFPILFFFSLAYSDEEIILRGSKARGLLRIVLEGPKEMIFKGKVRRGKDSIFVVFESETFKIRRRNLPISYEIHEDSIKFNTGSFKKYKAFLLDSPSRLIIDIFSDKEKIKIKSLAPLGTIVIDPGHGGYDTGLLHEEQMEKNATLEISKKIKSLLRQKSARVYLTRSSNTNLSLEERINFAKNKRARFFMSIHIGTLRDIIIYVPVILRPMDELILPYLINKGQAPYLQNSNAFSHAMKKSFQKHFKENNVTIKPVPYTLLSRIEGAALIIELPAFNTVIYNKDFIGMIAEAIREGFYFYDNPQ